jgi:hypothetical protein
VDLGIRIVQRHPEHGQRALVADQRQERDQPDARCRVRRAGEPGSHGGVRAIVAALGPAGTMAAMIDPATLSFNVVHLALAFGAGSLVGSWMNDSGFWIYCKMGGITEREALRSWTVLLIVVGVTAMAVNLLLAALLPMPVGVGMRGTVP